MRKLFTSLFVLLVVPPLLAQPLTQTQQARLDPAFRNILSRVFPEMEITAVSKRTPRNAAELGAGSIESLYPAIIRTDDAASLSSMGIAVDAVFPGGATARLSASDLMRVSRLEQVRYVDAGRVFKPANDIARLYTGADLVHSGFVNETPLKGDGVLLAVLDTGIDWRHDMFRDPDDTARSRILALWDLTLNPEGNETSPDYACCNYGVEYSREDIESELSGSTTGLVRTRDVAGHGTHVAGTAAGRGADGLSALYQGIAPEADLVVVKAGQNCFSEIDVINSLVFAAEMARELGRPAVANLSLGSSGGPHDGSGADGRVIDFLVREPGFVVVSSAGNDGDETIHRQGNLGPNQVATWRFTVPEYEPAELPEDRCELDVFDFNQFVVDSWMDGTEDVSVTVISPGGTRVTQGPGGDQTTLTPDGTVFLNNVLDPYNGDRNVQILVRAPDTMSTVANGVWLVELTNESAETVTYHTWLAESYVGPYRTVEFEDADGAYTTGPPGSADGAITVGSWAHRWRWQSDTLGPRVSAVNTDYSDNISAFSSRGPRRDGTLKPDITAPGERMASARSRDSWFHPGATLPGAEFVVQRGTSMSAPIVSGAAALLLEYNPYLTGSQVKEHITATATEDDYTGAVPNETWGYGKIDIFRAAVRAVNPTVAAAREVLTYDEWNVADETRTLGSDGYRKIALRFSPTINGYVTGALLHTTWTRTPTATLDVVVTENGTTNYPNVQIGDSAHVAAEDLQVFGWNALDFTGSGIEVEAGRDYQIVFSTGGPGQLIDVLLETENVANRTTLWTGSNWVRHNADLRARVVVATRPTDVDEAPSYPMVTSPADSVELALGANPDTPFVVDWIVSMDPEGQAVTHVWEMSAVEDFSELLYSEDLGSATRFETTYAGLRNIIQSQGLVFDQPLFLYYRVRATDGTLSTSSVRQTLIAFPGAVTAIERDPRVPALFALRGNYPNPFGASTRIVFDLPGSARVGMAVYDVTGRQVLSVNPRRVAAGSGRSLEVDASGLGSGVYVYRLTAELPDSRLERPGRFTVLR